MECVVNDTVALQVEALWKESYPDATLLPVIGLPSNSGGVLALTHTLGTGKLLKINGLPSKSPLANNALYTAECSAGVYLNLYEILIPDVPGLHGEISTGQVYVNTLRDNGLDVAGVHYHWGENHVYEFGRIDKNVIAVHHQSSSFDPLEFTRRTIIALDAAEEAILQRVTDVAPDPIVLNPCNIITDSQARCVEKIWKCAFPDATLLPVIGIPSNNRGVATLTHTMDSNKMKINGLVSNSLLSNNALYTFELVNGVYLNLYETMIPIVLLEKGGRSLPQIYSDALSDNGIPISAIHFHWTGSTVLPEDRGVAAIHHQGIGISPGEFSRRTIRALHTVMAAMEGDHHDRNCCHKKKDKKEKRCHH